MAASPVRILLEVEVIDESLIGRARASDGTTREFSGWLGLLKMLEGLLPDPRSSLDSQE